MRTPPKKVVVLGATGFLGRNVFELLKSANLAIGTSRSKNDDALLYLDITDELTWNNLLSYSPDIVINAIGYGVVKHETNIELVYQVNYFMASRLHEMIRAVNPSLIWIQIGTAFEYDLSVAEITEQSACVPRTHYGISKLMMTNYLLNKDPDNAVILRPFAMFGPHEDSSKIIPTLILSQLKKAEVVLSTGTQERDYCYVKDVAAFIQMIIESEAPNKYRQITNLGSGKPISLRALSGCIAGQLSVSDEALWQWGKLPQRQGESEIFFNASEKAEALGFVHTSFEIALAETIKYYVNVA